MEGVRFLLERGVGEREEAAGRHGGEPVQREVRRGEALVNELANVAGRRGDMDQEDRNDDEGYDLGKHLVFLPGHLALTPSKSFAWLQFQY